MTAALFTRLASNRYRASSLTEGPWQRDAMHGGAPAALLAHLIESVLAPADMATVRLSFDFASTVPVADLDVEIAVLREGKRTQVVDATLVHKGRPVLYGRALRIRIASVGDPSPLEPARTPAGSGCVPAFGDMGCSFTRDASEIRFAEGQFGAHGGGFAWHRLNVPIVEEEPFTSISRVAAAADFGNGVASILDSSTHVYINPDLTVALHRSPVGEWIGLESTSRHDAMGSGQTTTVLHDKQGRIGMAGQSLFLDRRP